MKKTILLLSLLLSLALSHAQSTQDNSTKLLGGLTNEDFFTKSDLVIRGISLGPVGFYETTINGKTDTNVVFAYRISEIYKGDPSLRWHTVYAVRKAGGTFFKWLYSMAGTVPYPAAPDVLQRHGVASGFRYGMSSIYFLSKSDVVDDGFPERLPSSLRYDFLYDDMSRLYVFKDKIVGLNDLVFQSENELFDYMKQFEGYSIPENTPPSKKRPAAEKIEHHTPPVMEVDSAMQKIIEKRWGEGKKKALTNPARSGRNTLTLQIANQEPVYDPVADKYYVKFDLLASSNNPNIYFDGVDLRIGYNSALFGTNIIANDKLTLSVGSYFGNSNGYAFFPKYDAYSNGVRIIYSGDLNHPNRVILDSTPRLLHFKIEVLPDPASNQSSITFLDTAATAANSSYTLSSDADFFDYIAYDKLFFIHSDTITVVTDGSPVITTNLSTISKIAGVSDTLAIKGYHFGSRQGAVYFTAADRGGTLPNSTETDFLKGLEEQYHSVWSDTLIKVIVPSLVYQGYENDTVKYSGGAGTGPVKIKTLAGDSCISTTSLLIPYSIANARSDEWIYRAYLARRNCDYDIQFTLHNDYRNDVAKIAVIDSALRHWSTLTGLTLVLEKDRSGNLVFGNTIGDDRNMIAPMHLSEDQSGIMRAERNFAPATFNNVLSPYLTTGSHIFIKENPMTNYSWNYAFSGNTSNREFNFYETFVHEIGHILLLAHVNDPQDLMYYANTPASPIITIGPSSTCVDAVAQNITASRALPWSLYTADNSFYPVGVKNPKISILSHTAPVLLHAGDIMTLSSNYASGNSWSTGDATQTIRISTPGTYMLSISEADWCTHSTSIAIAPSPLAPSFTVDNVRCRGESTGSIITQVAGGTPPYTYRWTGNGITPQTTANIYNLPAGTYNLLLSDNGGYSGNYTVSISEPEVLRASWTMKSPNGDMMWATPAGGTAPYTYLWYYESAELKRCNPIPAPYNTSASIPSLFATFNTSCVLYLRITDACGNTANTSAGVWPSKSAVSERKIAVYPNPTSGTFTISTLSKATAHLYSSTSGHIQSFENLSDNASIDISHLASGVYVLRIVEEGQVWHKKIVLQK